MADFSLPELSIDGFRDFFTALHGHTPFRWQTRLAEKACNDDWSDFIKLPTSSGKTACIDIVVFALAYQASRQKYAGELITASKTASNSGFRMGSAARIPATTITNAAAMYRYETPRVGDVWMAGSVMGMVRRRSRGTI